MSSCPNCDHAVRDHDDRGCRYGRFTTHPCGCPFGKAAAYVSPVARDEQVGGNHYRQFKIQPWDVIDEYGLDFYEGSALKYLLRHRRKNGVEDLKKCRHYLDRLIERAESDAGDAKS